MKQDISSESDLPAAKEMEGWLEREIADLAKAMELRVKDAVHFVAAYSRGELSPEEAAQQLNKYSTRWGEALPGVLRSRGISDEQILKRIDQTRAAKHMTRQQPRSDRGVGDGRF